MITPNRLAALIVSAVLTSACSDGTTEPVEQSAELTQLLSQVSAPAAPTGLEASLGLAAPALSPANCSYATASQSFACPSQTFNGITVARSFQLLTASGTPQSSFTADVVSIRVTTDLSGTVPPPPAPPVVPNAPPITLGSTTIARHEVLTLTGLAAGQQRRLNGTANSTMASTMTVAGITTSVNSTGVDTLSNIVVPATPPTAGPAFPLSGTAIHVETVSIGGIAPFSSTSRMVTTFNGTSTVTFTLTSAGITRTCTVNLAAAPPAPVCS